jgi:hypothetical protein
MSSNQSGEGEIRKNIIEADLVDCMVALPDKLFYSTGIPACLWFLARDKCNGRFRDRRSQVLSGLPPPTWPPPAPRGGPPPGGRRWGASSSASGSPGA